MPPKKSVAKPEEKPEAKKRGRKPAAENDAPTVAPETKAKRAKTEAKPAKPSPSPKKAKEEAPTDAGAKTTPKKGKKPVADNAAEGDDGAALKKKAAKTAATAGDEPANKPMFTDPPSKSPSGILKIVNWNVAGLRAVVKKGLDDYVKKELPDILVLQETKVNEDMNSLFPQYPHQVWSHAEQAGYSGTVVLSQEKPISHSFGLGKKEHDTEGRLITVEFQHFYLVEAYVPNSGRKLERLAYRQTWDTDLQAHLKKLEQKKPVIYCGDLNVAHTEIDLTNPKINKKTAGFTQEERDGMTKLLGAGFIDSFRHFHPTVEGQYSFWTYMGNARARNVGWRLDYFIVSPSLVPALDGCFMRHTVEGSDHCPCVLTIHKEKLVKK